MNELLDDETLWSLGARAEAEKRYGQRVAEIFYSEIETRPLATNPLRERAQLPSPSDGYAHVALLGVPGAGKTTLLRQLLGTNPVTERFPSTSPNRTTTFPTEFVLKDGPYEAIVTFMSEAETRFEVEESLSAAVVAAVDGTERQVARSFLEKSDMRFRLKYLLGDLSDMDEPDPYDEGLEGDLVPHDSQASFSSQERAAQQKVLADFIQRIRTLATSLRGQVEELHGPLNSKNPEERNRILDTIEDHAVASDDFLELVSDILEELRAKFHSFEPGEFERTATGWPLAWTLRSEIAERHSFLKNVSYFSGIAVQAWGKLFTPLVTGMHVAGPFRPEWASDTSPRLILTDTEGLGHKANPTADLPPSTLSLVHEAEVILLVESAKNGMTNLAAGKALEAVVNAGHTKKLAVVFTHMDVMKGDNLKGQAKVDHVFAGLRNVVENQVAMNVSPDAARYLLECLEHRIFYVGKLDLFDPKPAKPELNRLLDLLVEAQPVVSAPVAFPEYDTDNLVLAIQEAAADFRKEWQGILGLAPDPVVRPRAWQTIKALSRRYAEGWDDGFVLRPTSNLIAALSRSVSRFLENPVGWSGNPTPADKRQIIDRIRSAVSLEWPTLSQKRLRDLPQREWRDAYAFRGRDSTIDRKYEIEGIFQQRVPIPDSRGDHYATEFLADVKGVVVDAIDQARAEVNATGALRAGDAHAIDSHNRAPAET